MTQKPNPNESRRERIMNSDKQLPGDADRARDEEIEDFDAPSSAIPPVEGHIGGKVERRQQIDQSDKQLPGDRKRGEDDESVDRSIHGKRE